LLLLVVRAVVETLAVSLEELMAVAQVEEEDFFMELPLTSKLEIEQLLLERVNQLLDQVKYLDPMVDQVHYN
jgi:hypothetical protein